MPLIQSLSNTPAARLLAVVALLLVIGLQAQEAGHAHSSDDNVALCLLCQNSPDATPPVNLAVPPATAVVAVAPVIGLQQTRHAALSHHLARGPPLFS